MSTTQSLNERQTTLQPGAAEEYMRRFIVTSLKLWGLEAAKADIIAGIEHGVEMRESGVQDR